MDYTRDEMMQKLRNAHDAGDTEGASRIAEMIRNMPEEDTRGLGQRLLDTTTDVMNRRATKEAGLKEQYYSGGTVSDILNTPTYLAKSVANAGAGLMEITASLGLDTADYASGGSVYETIGAVLEKLPVEKVKAWYDGLSDEGKSNADFVMNAMDMAVPKGAEATTAKASSIIKPKRIRRQLNEVIPEPETVETKMDVAKRATKYSPKQEALMTSLSDDLGLTGLSPLKSNKANMNYLNKELGSLGNQIRSGLNKVTVQVTPRTIYKIVGDGINKLKNQPATSYLFNNNNKGMLKRVAEEFQSSMNHFDGTPSSILEVRKAFDKAGERLFGKDYWENPNHPSKPLIMNMRESLYNALEATTNDPDIRAMIRKQHAVLNGRDNLAFKMATTKGPISRTITYLGHHWGLPAMLAGGAAGMLGAPAFGTLGALAGAGYLGGRTAKYLPVEQLGNLGGMLTPSALQQEEQ